MCVEKDERITDSRIKSGIQTLLGGMVLGAIPVVFTGMFIAWDSLGTVTNEQQHILKSIASIERRINSLEIWRIETNGNRFRAADGELLRQAIASVTQELYSLKGAVTDHNKDAERYKEKIDHIEKDSHRHYDGR